MPPATHSNMTTSSPHTSDEASRYGTPSTIMTAYSPEQVYNDTGTDKKSGQAKVRLTIDTTGASHVARGLAASTDDVFLIPPTSARSQLSPTAETFTPGRFTAYHAPRASVASTSSFLSVDSAQTITGGARLPAGLLSPMMPHLSVSRLFASSVPEAGFSLDTGDQGAVGTIGDAPRPRERALASLDPNADLADAFGTLTFKNELFRDAVVHQGTFTNTDGATRGFLIANATGAMDMGWLDAICKEISTSKGLNTMQMQSRGFVGISFTDSRDCAVAMCRVKALDDGWKVVPMPPSTLASYTGIAPGTEVSDYEGHMVVIVSFDGKDNKLKANPIHAAIDGMLATVGQVKAIASLATPPESVREFHVEFFNSIHATMAIRELNGKTIGAIYVTTRAFNGEGFCLTQGTLTPPPRGPSPPPYGVGLAHKVPSLTGRTMVPLNEEQLALRNVVQEGVLDIMDTRQKDPNLYNRVVPHRIALGMDVRTTIMLRNIPNRIDQATLKLLLDQTSHGDYDFLYLRIDFSNNCNVGYAFINFVSAEAILPFAQVRAGHPWNAFNSNKVAEISYATIQGRENLVAKFRNSSVMCESSSCRPKLYKTGRGPEAGMEEPFPSADNKSKLARSFENAQHIGLFPPRHGMAYRREQRGRRSQFDRGTVRDQMTVLDRLYFRDPALFYELTTPAAHSGFPGYYQ